MHLSTKSMSYLASRLASQSMVLPYKKRFLVVQIAFEKRVTDAPTKQNIYRAVEESISSNFGAVGIGYVALVLNGTHTAHKDFLTILIALYP